MLTTIGKPPVMGRCTAGTCTSQYFIHHVIMCMYVALHHTTHHGMGSRQRLRTARKRTSFDGPWHNLHIAKTIESREMLVYSMCSCTVVTYATCMCSVT